MPPEDPNADPIELLKKSGKRTRENLKSKKKGKKKDPKPSDQRKGPAPSKAATNSKNSVAIKPPYSKEHYEQLKRLIGIGATLDDCARWFGISHNKLNDHCKRFYNYTFGEIYKQHRANLVISARKALYNKAIKEGYWPSLRYLLNNITEWSDSPEPEIAESTIIYESKIGGSGEIIKTIKNSEDLKTSEEFNASDTLNELLTIDAESKVIEDEK